MRSLSTTFPGDRDTSVGSRPVDPDPASIAWAAAIARGCRRLDAPTGGPGLGHRIRRVRFPRPDAPALVPHAPHALPVARAHVRHDCRRPIPRPHRAQHDDQCPGSREPVVVLRPWPHQRQRQPAPWSCRSLRSSGAMVQSPATTRRSSPWAPSSWAWLIGRHRIQRHGTPSPRQSCSPWAPATGKTSAHSGYPSSS